MRKGAIRNGREHHMAIGQIKDGKRRRKTILRRTGHARFQNHYVSGQCQMKKFGSLTVEKGPAQSWVTMGGPEEESYSEIKGKVGYQSTHGRPHLRRPAFTMPDKIEFANTSSNVVQSATDFAINRTERKSSRDKQIIWWLEVVAKR